jgi:hypothetical protein
MVHRSTQPFPGRGERRTWTGEYYETRNLYSASIAAENLQ